MIPTLHHIKLNNKTVLLRVDYNVHMKAGKIIDNSKIKESLDTIHYLLHKKCKIVIISHLGRPNGKRVKEFSLKPTYNHLQRLLPKVKITWVPTTIGEKVRKRVSKGEASEIFFLENLRYHKEEMENDRTFAHSLASLGEIYVNDAFAVSHRKHSSIVGVTKYMPSVAGIRVVEEIRELNKAFNGKKPSVWLIGGAKLQKVDFILRSLGQADHVLVGGALPFAFLKAKGFSIGASKTDVTSVQVAKDILRLKESKKIVLPVDFLATEKMSSKSKSFVVKSNEIKGHEIGLDLGPKTIKLFKQHLRNAHTIVWNGPLGYYEWTKYAQSTKEIGRFISKLTATTICGGGETHDALKKFHLNSKMTHVSSGGGASLAFLSGKEMPALTALGENYKKFKPKRE
jgi:3-phosphoglycerate kinase